MKYNIKMGCGHEETVDLVGKGSEREKKIKYYESFGLCKECYKVEKRKRKRKKEQEMGLVLRASVFPGISENGEILISLWFDGDSYSYKETIKTMNYYYNSIHDAIGLEQRKVWMKLVTVEKFPDIELTINLNRIFQSLEYAIAIKMKKSLMIKGIG